MIRFELRGNKFVLLRRFSPVSAKPASDWAGMRWVVLGASEGQTPPDAFQFLENYQRTYPWLCFQDEINDLDIRQSLGTKGLRVAHAELAWNIALGLADTKLCSEELARYCDVRQCSMNIEILDAVQSLYSSVGLELAQSAPFLLLDSKHQSELFQREVSRKAQECYLTPSPDLVRFFFLVLDHIHWFAIERFQRVGQAVGGLCCLWLGHDEFEIGAKYKLPVLSPPGEG